MKFRCSKCGYTGDGPDFPHPKPIDGSDCHYVATTDRLATPSDPASPAATVFGENRLHPLRPAFEDLLDFSFGGDYCLSNSCDGNGDNFKYLRTDAARAWEIFKAGAAEAESKLSALREQVARLEREKMEANGRADFLRAGFKNFHRSLCARFDYVHDEVDWYRDQVSLEENIALKASKAAPLDVERDAARYRWLRKYDVDSYLATGKLDQLDAAIDAALATPLDD